jgi:beta-lactam-binding protein with PASTA domain
VFSGLRPGSYTLRVAAPGFASTTQSVTVPTEAPVAVTLTRNAADMPAIFGQTLRDALSALADRSVSVARVLDVMGRDVAVARPSPDDLEGAVLYQLPPAGTPMPPGSQAQLVISASIVTQASVEMPELTGLTLAEAQRTLERLGLTLGRTETRRPRAIA